MFRDCFHGLGQLTEESGDIYTGNFRFGKYYGKGEFTYIDGRRYVGSWKNGLKDGKGVYEWPDGDIYRGLWRNGVRHGKGFKTKGNVTKKVFYRYNKKLSETIVSSKSNEFL